jgi:hypothetical protein
MSIGVITSRSAAWARRSRSNRARGSIRNQHSGLITSRQIEQIRVKARDVTSLMRILPGVRVGQRRSAGRQRDLVPHVGRQRRDWNTIMVDGVLGNEIGGRTGWRSRSTWTRSGNQGAAEHVRANAAGRAARRVRIVSRAALVHTGGACYGRHENFNANNFFNNRLNRDKPRYRFNIRFQHRWTVSGRRRTQKRLLFLLLRHR